MEDKTLGKISFISIALFFVVIYFQLIFQSDLNTARHIIQKVYSLGVAAFLIGIVTGIIYLIHSRKTKVKLQKYEPFSIVSLVICISAIVLFFIFGIYDRYESLLSTASIPANIPFIVSAISIIFAMVSLFRIQKYGYKGKVIVIPVLLAYALPFMLMLVVMYVMSSFPVGFF